MPNEKSALQQAAGRKVSTGIPWNRDRPEGRSKFLINDAGGKAAISSKKNNTVSRVFRFLIRILVFREWTAIGFSFFSFL